MLSVYFPHYRENYTCVNITGDVEVFSHFFITNVGRQFKEKLVEDTYRCYFINLFICITAVLSDMQNWYFQVMIFRLNAKNFSNVCI